MQSRLTRALALTGGIAAAGVLFAGAASAHGAPYTVTAGSAASGTAVAITGTATASVAFKDTVSNQTISCAVSVLKGSATTGSSSGSPVGTINGGTAVFANASNQPCTGPAGLKFNVAGNGTWNINATDSTSGVTAGTITNIRAHLSAVGATCEFDVGLNSGTYTSSGTSTVTPGTQGGTYTNSNQTLVTDPAKSALGLWNVNPSSANHNCVASSILKQGDSASFSGSYTLTADNSAYNPIAIN